jgi:DNA-binding winged helix-turn-helix (wHTH) protein
MAAPSEWFCALLDTAPDVYFRYALEPERRCSYVSHTVHALTGHTPAEFYANHDLCRAVVASADQPLLRRVLRSRRGVVLSLHVVRDGVSLPVEVRTVAVTRHRRIVAIEGVARLLVGGHAGRRWTDQTGAAPAEPVQHRLTSLMVEVHDLLHRVLPTPASATSESSRVLRLGELALDCDRLAVTESGARVSLTTREVMVLRYLLERPGRIVTRQEMLSDVWDYRYTGDDRTVDVHISRLRRKLPSLRDRLTAIRQLGYRLGDGVEERRSVSR